MASWSLVSLLSGMGFLRLLGRDWFSFPRSEYWCVVLMGWACGWGDKLLQKWATKWLVRGCNPTDSFNLNESHKGSSNECLMHCINSIPTCNHWFT
jgi:hypothetical protein